MPMQLQKVASGDLTSQSRTKHHSVPTRQLSHTLGTVRDTSEPWALSRLAVGL